MCYLLRVMILRRNCLFFQFIQTFMTVYEHWKKSRMPALSPLKIPNPPTLCGAGSHVGKIRKIISFLNAIGLGGEEMPTRVRDSCDAICLCLCSKCEHMWCD